MPWLYIIGGVVIFLVLLSLRIVNEYERGVIFLLGRCTGVRGPGLIFLIPIFEQMTRVMLRTITMNIPSQKIITKDNVSIDIAAVAYYHVVDPMKSVIALEDTGWQSTSPEIRKVLSGFVSQYLDYRSYLKYPDLHLPTTNNTAESLASMIADLKRRMRGFPTFRSFERWIVALLKYKKTIACNGFHQQN